MTNKVIFHKKILAARWEGDEICLFKEATKSVYQANAHCDNGFGYGMLLEWHSIAIYEDIIRYLKKDGIDEHADFLDHEKVSKIYSASPWWALCEGSYSGFISLRTFLETCLTIGKGIDVLYSEVLLTSQTELGIEKLDLT